MQGGSNGGPRRRLSFWRVLAALIIVGVVIYKGTNVVLDEVEQYEAKSLVSIVDEPWFAAYVDVTSTPTYAFEQPESDEMSDVVLSFIVASSASNPCIPSWGTHYTMDEAAVTLDLDRRIARLRQQGGNIAVSFGGALNSELALACTDPDKLFDAYKSVVERYKIDTIDLDLEGQSLQDVDAAKRRASVVARLQKEYRDNGKDMAVWLTLPVAPQGLAPAGTSAIMSMLDGGVDVSGVNGMTMDYGGSREEGQTMLDASKQALAEMHRQLGILYDQAGIHLSDESLWKKIGATPMIGQNDVKDEVFTREDAEGLNVFAQDRNMGRMSLWSANRNVPCGENYVNVKVVSDSCSGLDVPKGVFSKALSIGFGGGITQSADHVTTEDPKATIVTVDDPEISPYQIWQETGAYLKGTKVVWHGNVYEAKWWTKNDLPDDPVLQAWETPWQLVGPVLPGDKPVKQPTLPEGTYPEWNGETIYDGGNRVLFEGTPFQAKWWTQGESPAAASANPDSSPWMALTQKQIVDVLNGLE